jgi:LysM repeat protein
VDKKTGQMPVNKAVLLGFLCHKNDPDRRHKTCFQSSRNYRIMNPSNPFQIPACIQADMQQRQRLRVRQAVIAAVAVLATLLVALLIAGCVSNRSQTAAVVSPPAPTPDKAATVKSIAPAAPAPKPANLSPFNPASPSAAFAVRAGTPSVFSPAGVYVVKAGDTLTRIARRHRMTVKALKAANGLDTDTIAIGEKLKIPGA